MQSLPKYPTHQTFNFLSKKISDGAVLEYFGTDAESRDRRLIRIQSIMKVFLLGWFIFYTTVNRPFLSRKSLTKEFSKKSKRQKYNSKNGKIFDFFQTNLNTIAFFPTIFPSFFSSLFFIPLMIIGHLQILVSYRARSLSLLVRFLRSILSFLITLGPHTLARKQTLHFILGKFFFWLISPSSWKKKVVDSHSSFLLLDINESESA